MVASATKASHPLVTTVHASPRLPAPTRIWTQNVLLRTPAPNHMPRSTSSGAEPHLGVPRRGECSLAGGPRPTAVRPAAAALLGKAPCPKGLGGGASLQGDASHATTLLNLGKSRRGTTVAEHTRGLSLAPLSISHLHGRLAQGGVDRAGVDAETSGHVRKGEPGRIEVLCLLDVSWL